MKSRRVKAVAKHKSYVAKRKLKGNVPLKDAESDSGPDVDSDSIFHDEIDDFHQKEDEKLSTDDELVPFDGSSSEEEEVLPITDDEKEDLDEDNNDENEEGLPNSEAWGRKKSWYYDADFVDMDRGRTYRLEDAEAAKAEEAEALAIQKSVLQNITADNLGANLQFEGSSLSSEEEEEEKVYDWGSISKEEKLRFLKKSFPEFLPYIDEFKEKMQEAKERIEPILELMKEEKLPSKEFENYMKLKYQILLHYCLNISYYMMLKCQGSIILNHPVLQRIKSYKKLLDQLLPMDSKVKDDVNTILEKIKKKEDISPILEPQIGENMKNKILNTQNVKKQKNKRTFEKVEPSLEKEMMEKKIKTKQLDTETEKEIMAVYFKSKAKEKEKAEKEKAALDQELNLQNKFTEDMAEEKRTITYQIAKNKGLIAHRKKELKNPRVKHRMKFRKAKIRRKGQVREVIREIKRYDGEPTGISTHVVKSRKLK